MKKFIDSPRRMKQTRRNQNIKDYFKGKDTEEALLSEEVAVHASMEKGKMYYKLGNNSSKNRNKRMVSSHESEVYDYNFDKVSMGVFGATAIQAINLDPKSKLENAQLIYDKAVKTFKEAVDNDQLSVLDSPIFRDVFAYAKEAVRGIDHKLSDTEVQKTVADIYKANDVKLNFLVDNVSKKVIKAVADEKLLSKVKKNLKETEMYVKDEYSLFRSIHEANIGIMVHGKDQDKKNMIMNENADDLASKSLVNTIIDYTLIELLNTSKLIKFDYSDFAKRTDIIKANFDKMVEDFNK